MTKVLSELREKRNSHVVEMRNLMDKNKSSWSADVQAKYDEHDRAVADLDTQIKNTQRLLDLEAEERFSNVPKLGDRQVTNAEDVLARYMRHGREGLQSEEVRAFMAANPEFRNTMSTGTGNQGGYTVQKDVVAQIVENMAEFSSIRGVANILQTSQGNELDFPTSDDTSEEGEWVGENTTATSGDPTFGTVSVKTFKLSSKIVTVPIELIQDSSVDIVAYVTSIIGKRLGRGSERGYTSGNGSSAPNGFVGAADVGVAAATGNVAEVTYNHLVDLQHSVNRFYRRNGVWMFNDNTMRYVRKIRDDQQRPIFVPGYDSNVPGGEPDRLLNRPIEINDYMDDLGASNKPIAFGDFKGYTVRDVMQMLLLRFEDSKYMEKGQVGFLAWWRGGGNLTDVNSIKTYQNSAT